MFLLVGRVLSEHIRRVSACTSARSAGVAPPHRWAAPFARAQRLLRHLAVYRTPRDKVHIQCMQYLQVDSRYTVVANERARPGKYLVTILT